MRAFTLLVLLVPAFVGGLPPRAVVFPTATDYPGATVLRPHPHPADDPKELNNLKAINTGTLFYKNGAAFAAVHVPAFSYPAVSLERSHFIASVICNTASDTMTVEFTDHTSWTTAWQDWSLHKSGFIIVSFVDGCGSGIALSEHSFHLVASTSAQESERKIVCQIRRITSQTAVHPDHQVNIKFQSLHAGTPSPSTALSISDTTIKPRFIFVLPLVALVFPKFRQAVAKVVPGLKESYHLGHGDASFGFSTASTQGETPYGPGYTIKKPGKVKAKVASGETSLPGTDKKGKGSVAVDIDLALYLLDSYFSSKVFRYYGDVNLTPSGKDIVSGKLYVNADFELKLQLKVVASGGITATFESPALDVVIPSPISLWIPGWLAVGPAVSFSAGVDLGLKLKGELLAGTICSWPNVSVTFDIGEFKDSFIDTDSFIPTCKPIFESAGEVALTITPFLKAKTGLVLKAIQTLTEAVGVTLGLSLKAGLELGASISTKDDTCKQAGQVKLTATPKVAVALDGTLSVLSTSIPIYEPKLKPLADNCNANTASDSTGNTAADSSGGAAVEPSNPSGYTPADPDLAGPPNNKGDSIRRQARPDPADEPETPSTGDPTMPGVPPVTSDDTPADDPETSPAGDPTTPEAPPATGGGAPADEPETSLAGDPTTPEAPPATGGDAPTDEPEAPPTTDMDGAEGEDSTCTPCNFVWPASDDNGNTEYSMKFDSDGEPSFGDGVGMPPLCVSQDFAYTSPTGDKVLVAVEGLQSAGAGTLHLASSDSIGDDDADTLLALTHVTETNTVIVVSGDGISTFYVVACNFKTRWGLFLIADPEQVSALADNIEVIGSEKAEKCIIVTLVQVNE